MYQLNRFFAFLALFLVFNISGIALNLTKAINQTQAYHCNALIKETKANNSSLPTQFLELVDEREINDDEQIKINPFLLLHNQSSTLSFIKSFSEKTVPLPAIYMQNYVFQVPRVILFHSWKYFIS